MHLTDEVSTAVDEAHADLTIAGGGLSLRQGRLLKDTIGVRDVDRTALNLRILTEHARSSEGACTFVPPDEGALAGGERQI